MGRRMNLKQAIIPERAEEFNQYAIDSELKKIQFQNMESYFLYVLNSGKKVSNKPNSIVAYCVGITDEKPSGPLTVKKKGSMADIDLDVERGIRGNVITEITRWFGKDYVVPLITYSEMSSKRVVDDAGRALDISPSIRSKATGLIKVRQGKPDSIEDTIEVSEDFAALAARYPKWIEIAKRLQGNVRHVGMHASGIVVSRDPLIETMPLSFNATAGTPITQWDMVTLDDIGLTKVDLLGLETLDIAHEILDTIRSKFKKAITFETIDLNDDPTWKMIQKGRTLGVFQIESRMMRGMCKRLQPGCLKDLMLLSSLGRPGPMNATQFGRNTLDEFAARKSSNVYMDYHDNVAEVLRGSYGMIVYQEDVMECARILGGYDEGEVDKIRKIIGKKQSGEFEKLKQDYIDRGKELGYDEKLLDEIINVSSEFSGYGFNRSLWEHQKINIINPQGENSTVNIKDVNPGDKVLSRDEETGNNIEIEVKANHCHGKLKVFEIELDSGEKVTCTMNHKFRTMDGRMLPLWKILKDDLDIVVDAEKSERIK
jgi:DNA polymerase-3 subunit alpha